MWGVGSNNSVQSLVMVPIMLYQAEQNFMWTDCVVLFRRWTRDEWMPKRETSDKEIVGDHTGTTADSRIESEETLSSDTPEEGKE